MYLLSAVSAARHLRPEREVLLFENFKLILSKVPQYVRIDFSGMAEPWANPEATSMLADTLEQGFNVAIYTTLR